MKLGEAPYVAFAVFAVIVGALLVLLAGLGSLIYLSQWMGDVLDEPPSRKAPALIVTFAAVGLGLAIVGLCGLRKHRLPPGGRRRGS